jgi:hypothetical protein
MEQWWNYADTGRKKNPWNKRSFWTYGIPLWDTAGNLNIEILLRYQNKVLRAIVNAPWYTYT